jgi:hypothetical protein
VYDWDANPVMEYVTDVPLRSIAVDEMAGIIVGTSHFIEIDPELVIFNIKQLTNQIKN